ncbi:MAG: DinB family protein [Acidobacteria bacterium]|nr:DinB family protein [Acidobacteriota bacterium]
MIRSVWLVVALAVAAPGARAELSAREREDAVAHLQSSQKAFFAGLRGLTPSQWRFKPAPDRWSISEIADHLDLAEVKTLELVRGPVLQSPQVAGGELKGKEDRVYKEIADRSMHRMTRPDFLAPSDRWASPADVMRDFAANRAKTIEYVRTTKDDLRAHAAPHPEMGLLDGYEWIALLAAHAERHTAQIREVKTHPKFPTK